MPHLVSASGWTPVLAAGIDPTTRQHLEKAMAIVPPSYLFYAAMACLFLGILVRGRTAGWVYGTLLAIGVTSSFLWICALAVSTLFNLNRQERHNQAGASAAVAHAPAATCSTSIDCTGGMVCVSVGKDRRCRQPCSSSKPCPAGSSCIVPEFGPTVCLDGGH